MTTAEYITLITEGTLSLVKDNPIERDEATLGTNEYFVLMYCTAYKSYLRNYVQYKNKFNYNTQRKVYDVDIDKYAFYQGYYISKSYRKRHDINRGRTIIVSVVDRAAVIDLDDVAPFVEGLTDYDGNHYTTIDIGNQQWLVENYKTQHYENGVEIPTIEDQFDWLADTDGCLCCYENDFTYKNTRGLLYNGYALTNANGFVLIKRNGVPEAGWHIPTSDEIITLIEYTGDPDPFFGGYLNVGGKLKEVGTIHYDEPNIGATDEYGWKGYGCGNRFIDTFLNDGFSNLGVFADFFTSTEMFAMLSTFYLANDNTDLYTMVVDKYTGLCVRLMRNI